MCMFLSLHVLLVVVLFPRGLVGCMAAMSAKGETKGKGRGKGGGRGLVYAERGSGPSAKGVRKLPTSIASA